MKLIKKSKKLWPTISTLENDDGIIQKSPENLERRTYSVLFPYIQQVCYSAFFMLVFCDATSIIQWHNQN